MAENRIINQGKRMDFECHQMKHQLGAYTNCNHGEGLTVLHPVYYRHIYKYGLLKFKQFATEVIGVSIEGKTDEETALAGIEALEDLAGKTVGVQAASAALELLQTSETDGGQKELADTFGALNEFADYNTAFTELQAGALDALAIDIGVANYQIKSRGEGFTILSEELNTEQYAIAFKKGNEELRDTVDADLKKLTEDGTVAELAEKYDIADMVTLK